MYNVHLPIMLESERQAVYIERKKEISKGALSEKLFGQNPYKTFLLFPLYHYNYLLEKKMNQLKYQLPRPRGYNTFSMLNSAKHEIDPAHKC